MIDSVMQHLWRDETPYVFGAALVLSLLLFRALAGNRAILKHTLLFLAFWFLVDVAATLFAVRGELKIADGVHQVALLGFGLVLIRLSGLALFRVLLPFAHVRPPRILEDILVIAGYVLWALVRMSYVGVEVSGLVATSAVITAVLAFAMQDTLGNVLGGLALQLDNSLEVGDWVRIDDLSGRVVDIQWRYTAILTRNGEKLVVPNSQLMKSRFAVLLDSDLSVDGWRRWVWFNVDYAVPPAQVIEAVERALAGAEIAHVAKVPPPSCVAMDFVPGSVRYAVRYWLSDPLEDDPTDSAVRVHIFAALARAGWRIALPDQIVHVVKESEAHDERVREREMARRLQALSAIDLFAPLSDAERQALAEHLRPAPFAAGDTMTHQGALAHWLYIVVSGEAAVLWDAPDGSRHQIGVIPAGAVFGEMGLMTGAPRSTTIVARADVECYRLDKSGFESIIRARPQVAEAMSHILAERERQIASMQAQLQREASVPEATGGAAAILERIREFFALA
ncbi:mechanosensitive ion channel [Rhodocyclus tenuis]|uniref:Small-conductance mechanosensitive channel n=1 Tax=Rhodocyclus gracilis TaxID=2929842 RepID=A0ABX0WHY1_9RHOO|nr:mechanosensitive ion channel family protein [Rhodocyclus gracilis]NJA89321.1 mechanosensitive ion channel [Rhodocyclus gracilis]